MIQLRIPKSLRRTLFSKPANSIRSSTEKGIEPRQYEEKATQREHHQITACISLEGDILPCITLKFSFKEARKALIDTGASANAIREKHYEDLKSFCGNISQLTTPKGVRKNELAFGQFIPVRAN